MYIDLKRLNDVGSKARKGKAHISILPVKSTHTLAEFEREDERAEACEKERKSMGNAGRRRSPT